MGSDYLSFFSSAVQNRTHFSGVSSGLDLSGLIDTILKKESQPLYRLQERQEQLTNRQKALQLISEKMQEFRTFTNRWKLQSQFFQPTITSTREHSISGTGTGYVPNISFQAKATQLAQSETLSSSQFNGTSSTRLSVLGATTNGTLTIKVDGQEYTINYNPEDTLQQLASRIQGQAGLRAFVTTSTAGSRFHIAAPDASVDIQGIKDTGAFLTRMGLLTDYASKTLVTRSTAQLQDMGISSGILNIQYFDVSANTLVTANVEYLQTDTLTQLVEKIKTAGIGRFEARLTDMGILQIIPTAGASRIVNLSDDGGGNLSGKIHLGMGSVLSKEFSSLEISNSLNDFGVAGSGTYSVRVFDRLLGTEKTVSIDYDPDSDSLSDWITRFNEDPENNNTLAATFGFDKKVKISSASERYVLLGQTDTGTLNSAMGLGGVVTGGQTMITLDTTLSSLGTSIGGKLTLEAHNSSNNTTQAFAIDYTPDQTIGQLKTAIEAATGGLFEVILGTDDKIYIRGAYGNLHVRSLTDTTGGSLLSSLGISSEADSLARFRSKVLTTDPSFPLSSFGVISDQDLSIQYLDATTGRVMTETFNFSPDMSLTDLITAINDSSSGFLQARLEADNRLHITGKTPTIRVLSMDDEEGGLLSGLGMGSSRIASQTAKMQVNIGGVLSELESNTNTFRDAVTGVNLEAYNTGEWTTITANTNIQATMEHIEEFVETYNKLMEFLHTKLNEDPYTPEPGSEKPLTEEQILQGMLKNNPLVRQIFSDMRNMVYTSMDGGTNRLAYGFLTNMGIGSTDGLVEAKQNIMMGKIAVIPSSLESALRTNPEAVWEAFGIDSLYAFSNQHRSNPLNGGLSSTLGSLGASTAGRISLGYTDVSTNQTGTISIEYLPGQTLKDLIDSFNNNANGKARMELDSLNQLSIQTTSSSIHIQSLSEVQRINEPRQVGNLLDRFGIRSIDSKTIPVQGFAERLSSYLHEHTKYNGRIDQTAGINGTLSQQIRSINREITNWAKRLETRYVSLWARFSRLEKNLANMQRQSEYMANAFQQLSGRNQP